MHLPRYFQCIVHAVAHLERGTQQLEPGTQMGTMLKHEAAVTR